MKKCLNCGKQNRDENAFCSDCGGSSFEPMVSAPVAAAPAAPVPPAPPVPPLAPVYTHPTYVKPEITKFDLLTILGFVSSIVGVFYIGLILEPLAAVTSLIGFLKGKRFRGLAVAGFVIAIIALLVRLFYTLYVNGVIPKWLVSGSFDM